MTDAEGYVPVKEEKELQEGEMKPIKVQEYLSVH